MGELEVLDADELRLQYLEQGLSSEDIETLRRVIEGEDVDAVKGLVLSHRSPLFRQLYDEVMEVRVRVGLMRVLKRVLEAIDKVGEEIELSEGEVRLKAVQRLVELETHLFGLLRQLGVAKRVGGDAIEVQDLYEYIARKVGERKHVGMVTSYDDASEE